MRPTEILIYPYTMLKYVLIDIKLRQQIVRAINELNNCMFYSDILFLMKKQNCKQNDENK